MSTPVLTLKDWSVDRWLNVTGPDWSVEDLADRVVIAAAFQMLCPGCVDQTIPQLRRAASLFRPDDVAIVGLHTVFEHHEAMTAVALRAFLHEYRVAFPVAIDQPGTHGPIPVTMERFAMQGTPTMMLYDRASTLRLQHFGHIGDMQLGVEVTRLQQQPREPGR